MPRVRRVVVIGFDGLDPKTVDRLLAAGALPAFARLSEAGGYARVATTTPAQTPVAWSTFATGTNPGGHGIYDFVRRDPSTYLPDFALNRFEQKSIFLPPRAVNLRRGVPVWELLSQAGVPSVVLRCPCTFPPDAGRARMLSGMGVPDLRGGLGTPTFYTTDAAATAGESEQLVQLRRENGLVRTHVIGPRHPKTRENLQHAMTLRPEEGRLSVTLEGGAAVQLEPGRWSNWLRVRFKAGLLQPMGGMVRLLLIRTAPELELYASPVNFDPEADLLYPVSAPPDYARELAKQVGAFYTTGMVEDHGGLSNGRFGEADFLALCDQVLAERERMLQYELARQQDGLVYCLFDTPDRVQHMFWRFLDPDHPANREGRCEGMEQVIDEQYRHCDAILGRVLEQCDQRTLVIALSDHGFGSFRRGLHINAWLRQEGLLALRPDADPANTGEMGSSVDWSRTQAYAIGIGSIYLNLRGREARGVLPPGDAPDLTRRIAERLTGLRDPANGTVAVRGVATAAETYHGAYAAEAPDLVVRFAEGYRASWATALGGVPADLFEDNVKKWSGDHIVDPDLVPGVLLMSQPFAGAQARLVDLAPTVLSALGVQRGAAMEGENLLS